MALFSSPWPNNRSEGWTIFERVLQYNTNHRIDFDRVNIGCVWAIIESEFYQDFSTKIIYESHPLHFFTFFFCYSFFMENSILLLLSSIFTFLIAHTLYEIVQRKAILSTVLFLHSFNSRFKKKRRNAKLQKNYDGRSELVELVQKRFIRSVVLMHRTSER